MSVKAKTMTAGWSTIGGPSVSAGPPETHIRTGSSTVSFYSLLGPIFPLPSPREGVDDIHEPFSSFSLPYS